MSDLKKTVEKHVKEDNMHFMHSFDDVNVICGCARYFNQSSTYRGGLFWSSSNFVLNLIQNLRN